MKTSVSIVTLVFGIVLAWTSALADFYVVAVPRGVGTEIKSLPYTITSPGFYYITKNLTSTGSGIIVNADDVIIDLMGFSLVGPDSGDTHGIQMSGRTNVEIRNGTVRDFGFHGIYESLGGEGNGHRVLNVRAVSNMLIGISLYGQGHLVSHCTAADNGLDGIHVSKGCTVTDNRVYRNGRDGIRASSGSTVIGNSAYSNEDDGIWIEGGSTATENTAYGNGSNGINAHYHCLVLSNTAVENNQSDGVDKAGIRTSTSCQIKGNIVNSNLRNNIYVWGYYNVIEENQVIGSTNGIKFNLNPNFYANNRASDNTTDYSNTTSQVDGGGNVSF